MVDISELWHPAEKAIHVDYANGEHKIRVSVHVIFLRTWAGSIESCLMRRAKSVEMGIADICFSAICRWGFHQWRLYMKSFLSEPLTDLAIARPNIRCLHKHCNSSCPELIIDSSFFPSRYHFSSSQYVAWCQLIGKDGLYGWPWSALWPALFDLQSSLPHTCTLRWNKCPLASLEEYCSISMIIA